jgi:hypothetical protein
VTKRPSGMPPIRSLLRSLLLALLVSLTCAPVVSAQTSDAAAVRTELAAIRQSLDQLVTTLKQLLEQNTKRDLTTALLQRLDAAERRVTQAEAALKEARLRKAEADAELVKTQTGMVAFQEMAKQDTTGSAAEAIAAEQTRMQAAAQQKATEAQILAQEVARLEGDLAAKQRTVSDLEQALNRQFGGK